MLENRLRLAKELLNERGSIFVRCDYNGNMYVRLLMNEIFGEENFRNEIVISRTRAKQQVENRFIQQTESLFFYSNTEKFLLKEVERPKRIPEWHPLLHFPRADDKPRVILGKVYYPPKGRRWALSQERINKFEEEYIDCKGNKVEGVPELLYDTEIVGNEWVDIPGYSQAQHFPTENSEILLKRVIESTSDEGDLVMDFFLGSGTTTAVAHKLKRKWIGVEMGEHFWTVVMPRMKRVLAYDKTGISKEKDVKEKYNERTAGGFFKYIILEQYEDTLDNLELKESKPHKDFFKDDYLIKYFLELETKDDPHLLNISMLKDPYNYKLKVNLSEVGEPKEMAVDVIETFNYLLGLKINKLMRKEREGNIYTFVLGEREGKSVAVVWRVYSEGWTEEDYKKDRDFIEEVLKEFNRRLYT
jgi:adenine-specific DNA-methyltransferase